MKAGHQSLAASFLILCSIGLPAAADEAHWSTLKGIFLDRERHPNINGLRFDIMLERRDGSRAEVPVNSNFHNGDRFWLRMDAMDTTYVYVLNRTLTGDKGVAVLRDEDVRWPPSAPDGPRLVFGPQRMSPGKSQMAPKTGALRFDSEAGIEKLYVILSPTPLGIESSFGPDGQMLGGPRRDVLGALNKNMVAWSGNADVAAPDTGSKGVVLDPNGYCVGRRPNEPLMVELTLRHSN